MAIDFPNSPSLNQEFTVGARTWKWNGSTWRSLGTLQGVTGLQGLQGFTGLQGITGSQGTQGTTGTQGVRGAQGFANDAIDLVYIFGGPSGAVPGIGEYTTNSNNPATVTTIRISKYDVRSQFRGNEIASWDDFTTAPNRGRLYFTPRDLAQFAYGSYVTDFNITSDITDNGDYFTITVANGQGSIFNDDMALLVQFIRHGAQGVQGPTAAQGATGTQGLQGIQGNLSSFTPPNYTAGYYFDIIQSSLGTAQLNSQRLFLVPFAIHRTVTITSISCEVTTASTGGSGVGRLCLYNYDNSDNEPGTLLVDAGTVSFTSPGLKTSGAISQQLTPGLYFAGLVHYGAATTTGSVRTYTAINRYFADNATSISSTASVSYYDGDTITTTLPTTPSIDGVSTTAPRIILGM